MLSYYEDDKAIKCPKCGALQGDVAEDYVAPSRVESHDCHECYQNFDVQRIGENKIAVS